MRHYNISIIIDTQKYRSINTAFRSNMTGIVCFTLANLKEYQALAEEHSNLLTSAEFKQLFNYATTEPYSFLFINYQKRQAPTLVRGGIRCRGSFYALRPDEEAIVRFLHTEKKAPNDLVLAQIANSQLSYSQNSKRKADAILAINALMTKLSGKALIVGKKALQDKRQIIYYLTPNILQ